MTYLLSYAGFETYIGDLDRRRMADRALGMDAQGESLARTYVWTRFVRCHGKPVLPEKLYPIPDGCEPAVFEDAEHWDRVYRNLARRRVNDARKAVGPRGVHLVQCNDFDDEATINRVADPGAGHDDEVVVEDELAQLRDAIEKSFDVDVAYGPEIRSALLVAIDDVACDRGGDLLNEVNRRLGELLPDSMGPDQAGRQRRSRAVRRAGDFVQKWGSGRNWSE